MGAKIVRRDRLSQLVDAFISDYEVIAPKDELSYGRVSSADEVYLSCEKPHRSLKEFFFPERETLLNYEVEAQEVRVTNPVTATSSARIIFGAHPCDAAAFPILDRLFDWDYLDSSYRERRENTTIVTIACDEPPKTCFCTSLGGSPAGTDGADLLLSPLADAYHVQVISERGQALVERYPDFFLESDEAHNQERERLEAEWRERVPKTVDMGGLAESLDFENPIWQTITQQCIDCGICTFLCPTCHCFDIQDEGDPDKGSRIRLWDSCASRAFTETAAHQPRPTHHSRYRQRIMHKFKYYVENFGETLCVGCGRCIRHCPVGIDITNVLQLVKE